MGTKFASVTVSSYNASPPADDGSTSASNQVKWSTQKTKLTDPLNTAIAAINSGLITAFDYSARSITTGDTTIAGDHMRTIEIAPTVSSVVTLSLGDAATMAAGYTINIVNRSNFTCVVGRATASDTIGGTAANDVLLALNSVTYKVNSTANGYVVTQRGSASAASTTASTPSKNYAVNGSFAVNQDVTPTTTDNSYPFDGWRLLLGAATAATISQDTADVPVGAGFAAKLAVGAANNNKFGIFCPIENKDMLDLRGGTCSIRVPLKATAALTNTRIGIVQWTGTGDAISATPISAWNAAGTNPTLIANWAFANVPASLSVTTAWADYTVASVSISASATNIGILIWSDDKTNSAASDILRVGGYVTLAAGTSAPAAQVAPFDAELRKCQRYFWKTFPQGTAPAQNAGTGGSLRMYQINGSGANVGTQYLYPTTMRTSPTLTSFNPSAANAQMRWATGAGDDSSTSFDAHSNDNGFEVFATTNAGSVSGGGHLVHVTANARL